MMDEDIVKGNNQLDEIIKKTYTNKIDKIKENLDIQDENW